ncbi:MAG: hypothetical protein ACRELV_01195, partial [Longimicrobiales bacterium]
RRRRRRRRGRLARGGRARGEDALRARIARGRTVDASVACLWFGRLRLGRGFGMSAGALVGPTLHNRLPRILGLVAFAGLFLLSALVAATFFRDAEGHVALGELFAVGGYPLASALLLLGWLIGRFPLIAILVLVAGLVSRDRASGRLRLYAARPASLLAVYALRFAVLAVVAFALSALLMPTFDLLLLGDWAGPATFVLILAQVLVYGGLAAFLSVWTRADAWIALGLAVTALVWEAALRAPSVSVPEGPRAILTLLLPPQWAMLELESAFAALQPIPWDAFAFTAGYGLAMLLLAGVSLAYRER